MLDADTATDGGFDETGDDGEFALDNPNDTGAEAGEGQEEGDPKPEPEAKAPLTPEELDKRWRDAKGATHAERAKRREAENRARELEGRLQAIEQSQQRQDGGEKPDYNDDPIGYLAWLSAKVDAMDAQDADNARQAQERQRSEAVVNDIQARTSEYEADFRETNPDYGPAMVHLYQARGNDYMQQGYTKDQAMAAVQQEMLASAHRCLSNGQDPAAVAYNLAKARGFGAAAASDANKAKLERIQEGQKAASPLAGAGGRGSEELTLEGVNKLTGPAFIAAAEKLERQMIRRERGF